MVGVPVRCGSSVTEYNSNREAQMSDPHDGLPSGVDPSDPGVPNDSSLGADRAAAIESEKAKWRQHERAKAQRRPARPAPDPGSDAA